MGVHDVSQRVAGKVLMALFLLVTVSAENTPSQSNHTTEVDTILHATGFYHHTWPSLKFGWRIIAGTIVGFLGAAFGNVGGVGGGGIFVPMLTLIIGFDSKSAIALSKCMITGGAIATVFYNLRQRHPTLDLPEAQKNSRIDNNGSSQDAEHSVQTGGLVKENANQSTKKVSIIENIQWKELGLLFAVWIMILALQIGKYYTTTCSGVYWALNVLQVPIALGMSSYQAMRLYKGQSTIASKGDQQTQLRVSHLILFCGCGTLAGTIAGLLGLGGGFIMAPLFLGLGIPPQVLSFFFCHNVCECRFFLETTLIGEFFTKVASATSILAMAFSASLAVVEYYLLKRFPIPYVLGNVNGVVALYLVAIATVASLFGQHLVRKMIAILGRASIIIFVLTFTLCVSAVLLGGVGVANMIDTIEDKEYMGFGNLCMHKVKQ
ncbi:unnamed protein product [Sphenostylis stenocarpa]|uniref:Sulfite exporter TauE/SafE family protein n=1 Tax=Sphenostylis stenocarpa TaxID=92480 RepID=A0AA86SRU1_9FABA|nr:unnamed protein product [Sphenostylis stenocarpa]